MERENEQVGNIRYIRQTLFSLCLNKKKTENIQIINLILFLLKKIELKIQS